MSEVPEAANARRIGTTRLPIEKTKDPSSDDITHPTGGGLMARKEFH